MTSNGSFYGQLGIGSDVNPASPHKMFVPHEVLAAAAGGSHSLVLCTDGSVWGCGWKCVIYYGVMPCRS